MEWPEAGTQRQQSAESAECCSQHYHCMPAGSCKHAQHLAIVSCLLLAGCRVSAAVVSKLRALGPEAVDIPAGFVVVITLQLLAGLLDDGTCGGSRACGFVLRDTGSNSFHIITSCLSPNSPMRSADKLAVCQSIPATVNREGWLNLLPACAGLAGGSAACLVRLRQVCQPRHHCAVRSSLKRLCVDSST